MAVVAVLPSPKFQAYEVIVPAATVEAEASNNVGVPAAATLEVKAATGAWSGVMAGSMSSQVATPIALPASCVERLTGITVLPSQAVIVTPLAVAVAGWLSVMLFVPGGAAIVVPKGIPEPVTVMPCVRRAVEAIPLTVVDPLVVFPEKLT